MCAVCVRFVVLMITSLFFTLLFSHHVVCVFPCRYLPFCIVCMHVQVCVCVWRAPAWAYTAQWGREASRKSVAKRSHVSPRPNTGVALINATGARLLAQGATVTTAMPPSYQH